jgi:aryl-alcohol dehydrogenase-like predicted oxidoreductase
VVISRGSDPEDSETRKSSFSKGRARLGSQGPEITRVGFGAWAVGGSWAFGWGAQDDSDSIAAIRHAVESGVNWVDTAAVYGFGHSEEVVGRALSPYKVGEEVLVFTKCGRVKGPDGKPVSNLTPESIRKECEASLSRLGVERIDLFQFHWPDLQTGTPVEESWATMVELQEEGKIAYAGVSNFTVELLERCEAIRHVDSLQPPLSMLDRRSLPELIPWCAAHGVGVIAYSPMASGLLTGAFSKERLESLAPDDWRRNPNHPDAKRFQEPMFSKSLELVDRLRPIAAKLSTSLSSLAVAWVLAQPGVTGGIVGARTPAQVDGWLDADSVHLDEETLQEMELAWQETVGSLESTSKGLRPPD